MGSSWSPLATTSADGSIHVQLWDVASRQLKMTLTVVDGQALAFSPGGTFLAKVFQSGADAELVAQLKRDFSSVRHVKPASSRQDSSERYMLATGFRGGK